MKKKAVRNPSQCHLRADWYHLWRAALTLAALLREEVIFSQPPIPSSPYSRLLLRGSPCLACLSLRNGKKNRKVISFSHYRWPFHWPGVIAIMRCGSRGRLWWGVRANNRASTNILSTLYLDTARLFARLVVAQSAAFTPERFPVATHVEMALDNFTRKTTWCYSMCSSRRKREKKKTAGRGKKQRVCVRGPGQDVQMSRRRSSAALRLIRWLIAFRSSQAWAKRREEVTGTARNTLILEFKASMSRLERDNPITPRVTAVHTRLGIPAPLAAK